MIKKVKEGFKKKFGKIDEPKKDEKELDVNKDEQLG